MNIYDLKLHEKFVISGPRFNVVVMRVPGGWIYNSLDKHWDVVGSVFVPYIDQSHACDMEIDGEI